MKPFFIPSARINFKTVGPRLGSKVKQISSLVQSLSFNDISNFQKTGQINIAGETLYKDDIFCKITCNDNGYLKSAHNGEIGIILDTELNDDLLKECIAREITSKVQNMRRNVVGISDNIWINFETSSNFMSDAIVDNVEMISCICKSDYIRIYLDDDLNIDEKIEGHPVTISIQKKNESGIGLLTISNKKESNSFIFN